MRPDLDQPRVVYESKDFFPNELLGFPPQRDVDFCIELHPSTSLISMTSHGMALVELQELKVQIQELLDKGVREISITGPILIKDTLEKVGLIRKRLLTTLSWQKSYSDKRRQPLEFEVGDHIFLKVMSKRGVVRFGKRGKLAPRYIRPFEILKRVGTIAYRLALPPSFSSVHEVFHVSMLRKYTLDPTHVVDWGEITVDTDGTFEE